MDAAEATMDEINSYIAEPEKILAQTAGGDLTNASEG